jgi:hypothetical protein
MQMAESEKLEKELENAIDRVGLEAVVVALINICHALERNYEVPYNPIARKMRRRYLGRT